MSRPWRFISSPAQSGARNMAIDEALLQSFLDGQTGPVFRTYTWAVPTISLGRFQDPQTDLNWDYVEAQQAPLVRRMTGGGAIYHARELTYSLVCHQDDLGSGTVKESFARLCQFLLRAYGRLGLKAAYAVDLLPQDATLGQKTAFCFAGKELYDILIDGKKLGGNAQRRVQKTIFQHGSIPLYLDWPDLNRLFKPGTLPQPEEILALGPLWNNAPWQAAAAELAGLVQTEFAANLDIAAEASELTAAEAGVAADFESRKYGSRAWTLNPGA